MRNDQEVRAKALELGLRVMGTSEGGLTRGEVEILLKRIASSFAAYISEGVVGDVPNCS